METQRIASLQQLTIEKTLGSTSSPTTIRLANRPRFDRLTDRKFDQLLSKVEVHRPNIQQVTEQSRSTPTQHSTGY